MTDSSAPRTQARRLSFKIQAPEATAFIAPAFALWRRFMMALMLIAFAHTLLFGRLRGLTELFFYGQDLVVAGLMLLILSALLFARPFNWRSVTLSPSWRTAALLALLVALFAWAGTFVIYDNFALSMDEFMARFDARIFATGRLAAPVPQVWREFTSALEPTFFMLPAPSNAFWVSAYLPVNAAFLALASKLGAESAMPPLWGGLSILLTFGVARQLWPEKPRTALIAAGLLATAPQLLITAMTPYAMSAHLALNLAWLWLVLQGRRTAHTAAAGVAFLAAGLHQLVFHPLFAAPLVLEMWLAKRWRAALWHTCAYAFIGVFWALYPSWVQHSMGAPSVAGAASGQLGMVPRTLALLRAFDPTGLGLMAKNLVRFATWQSLLTVPLALAALVPAIRTGGVLRGLAIGVLLTILAMFVLLPYQGHGWGYRYLHGLMGSLCLLAAWGWSRIGPTEARRPAPAIFSTAILASVVILLPLRTWQVHRFEHPYFMAAHRIQAAATDIVLVEDAGVFFGGDLVRNDPLFRRGPLVLRAADLAPAEIERLCERHRVAWFTQADAKSAGIRTINTGKRAATPCTGPSALGDSHRSCGAACVGA